MDRRNFVRRAALSGPLLGGALQAVKAPLPHKNNDMPQWYELRTYMFTGETQQRLTSDYLQQALLPGLNRAGIQQVGVFEDAQPGGLAKSYLFIPFDDLAALASVRTKLAADKTYQQAGAAYLQAPAANPAYDRIESSLLRAFRHMPHLALPEKKDRLFELRCYESPSESAGQKKIEMFNDAGEIEIFKRVGARPVFFGETIIGERRPNLIYMLCFDNMEAHDACWKAFGNDPQWKKLKAMDEYSDARLISKITRTFLTPPAFSQI
jgi:NIPSNAP protein